MSSWYSSWLPGLPSIEFALPSSIQRRFISFALKKSLGHLLKPGQLDIHQIDSQIGSGYVQVNDLELDNEAINSSLMGLPVQLHDGYIAAVTARIPWPNPLTSTLGASVQSLHLTFHVIPSVSEPLSFSTANLAESVASVAESFIHDELSPREEATLRESFHPDLAASLYDPSRNVPGSMDPFLHASDDEEFRSDTDPAGVSIFATLIERLLARFEFDAKDTKITLVHPGHASFTFSVAEIRYGTEGFGESPDSVEKNEVAQTSGEIRKISIAGLKLTARNLRSSPAISSEPLTPSTASPVSPTTPSRSLMYSQSAFLSLPGSPMSPTIPHHSSMGPGSSYHSPQGSPASSSSSMDEDTTMFMSQSLAELPPRAASPAGSVTSSMYQSAISIANEQHHSADNFSRSSTPAPLNCRQSPGSGTQPSRSPEPDLEPEGLAIETNHEDLDELILSLGEEPIIIRLTTPPVPQPSSEPSEDPFAQPASPSSHSSPKAKDVTPNKQSLNLTISAGVLACAFRAWHIRAILGIANMWGSHRPPPAPKPLSELPAPSTPSHSLFTLGLDASINMRGMVILILASAESGKGISESPLAKFFARPLVPPQISPGCLRVFVDSISASCSFSTSTTSTGSALLQTQSQSSLVNLVAITFTVNDISAFTLSCTQDPDDHETKLIASPILITDPNLAAQYQSAHAHPDAHAIFANRHVPPKLPTFAVQDWTDRHRTDSVKLSTWRSKAKSKPARRRESHGAKVGLPSSPSTITGDDITIHTPAISVHASFSSLSANKVKGPRHMLNDYIDVDVVPIHIFLDFGSILGSNALAFMGELSDGGEIEERAAVDDEDEDDNAHSYPPEETETQRLERLVLEDLDLDLNYLVREPPKKAHREPGHAAPPRKPRRTKTAKQMRVTVHLEMIRLQARCPPPRLRPPRSGAFIVDLHGIRLHSGSVPERKPAARFSNPSVLSSPPHPQELSGRTPLLTADCQRLVIAVSLVREEHASTIVSLGPLSNEIADTARFDAGASPGMVHATPLPIRISVGRSEAPSAISTVAVTADVPSVHVNLSKSLLDGLQLWADDVSQLVEATFGGSSGDTDTERADSRNPSLIGSRFFAKSKGHGSKSSVESSSLNPETRSETVVKTMLSEVFVRIMLPREDTGLTVRPIHISASDVDILLELKPEGKDETVVTLGIMDIKVEDTSPTETAIPFLFLTTPRNLSTSPQPLVKLRFTSLVVPETTAKESRVKVTLWGFTYNAYSDIKWLSDLARFSKAPPGAFESVIPSERTRVNVAVIDGSIRAFAPVHPGCVVIYVGELNFATDIVGDSPEVSFHLAIPAISLLLTDDLSDSVEGAEATPSRVSSTVKGIAHWKESGYALLAEIANLDLKLQSNQVPDLPSDTRLTINNVGLRVHLCADTLHALAAFISDVTSAFKPPADTVPKPKKRPTTISQEAPRTRGILSSVDEHAFRRVPDVGPAPDMISDDLPSNLDYLDESFGAAAGLRELRDDDLDDFDVEEAETGRKTPTPGTHQMGIVSNVGGETIKMLRPLNITEHHFNTLPPDSTSDDSELGGTTLRIRVHNCDVALFLYEGYDWARTRKTIEEEVKEMRRRLTKIRQLVATGQTQDPSVEDTSALLFNSVYIGLEQDVDELEPGALIAAIDEELLDDDVENESQSSWQSLRPQPTGKPRTRTARIHGKRLTRSKGPSIEFKLTGVDAEVDQYRPGEPLVSRTLATVRDLEILDHIKTSTWQKFLTELRSDSRGNVRETESDMVRVELRTVRPVPSDPSEEARLRAKLLPLRLYVDQDALDFLKKFFSFKDTDNAPPTSESSDGEIYLQRAEVFPVDIKLDYKPRRVDYRALREGKTIELMNFFHFDGSEMTLRHITVSGVTGWPRFFDMLNDMWTPDVKATQLVDVISGVSPIRSVVNVGSGVADLVLLPIAQYKKDGRIVRGMQKGTTAFVKSTAMEAIKLGARLATGTQVILEQAENVLGGQFKDPITTETLQLSPEGFGPDFGSGDEDEVADLISRYAQQPIDVKEGVQFAYKSLQRNLNSAAQTILAVPMEVYERSGNEGPVRAVIRAVPIAVLRPMIGASEAVSKTLMGLQNTMDPNIRHENEDKYKHR